MGSDEDRRPRVKAGVPAREVERWIAWVRLGAVPFAVFQVIIGEQKHVGATWSTTVLLAAGAVAIFWLSRRTLSGARQKALGIGALTFDVLILSTYVLLNYWEPGSPTRQLLYLAVVEAALRYGIRGGVGIALATAPVVASWEWLATEHALERGFELSNVTFQLGVQAITGLIVGWLVERLAQQTQLAGRRAEEAERLRDELGRRVDLLEAANRCARALGSSLELEQAFGAFMRELRGVVPFDRMAIVLAEEGAAEVIATAGRGADETFPPGTRRPVEGSVLETVLRGELVYREDMAGQEYPEEEQLVALGLRSRLAAPLLAGPRAVGMLALVRREPHAFGPEEIELARLLGRLVATGVQHIRAYEAERSTADELRRLSALRADFVSLVSHELRSPMAAVIGSARTLQQRWRELAPEQRESFLALIADETTRLADLIGDVLDTSRIEAGTFSYSFSSVPVGELVRETVAAAGIGQDEVTVVASVRDQIPPVRGDRERLRQVLMNLIDNAVKYSPAGAEVRVAAYTRAERVLVDVADSGPGIAPEHQSLIFEKFGRAKTDGGMPGTGLGLFIARSIVEAHGGTLEVRSTAGRGSTFTVALPIG